MRGTIECVLVLSQAQYIVRLTMVCFFKAVDKNKKNNEYKCLRNAREVTLEYKNLLI